MTGVSIFDEKKALRKAVLARRDSLDVTVREHKSQRICDELSRLYDEARDAAASNAQPFTVAIYYAFGSEVNLDAFTNHVWSAGGRVAFPCMEKTAAANASGRKCRMSMRLIPHEVYLRHTRALNAKSEDGNDAKTAKDLIPFLQAVAKSFDPNDYLLAPFPPIAPHCFSMVVVPLVAFDSQGGRLGYGGGNYDEFLPRLQDNTLVVGVGFEEQRVDAVPREAHDLTLPRIISA